MNKIIHDMNRSSDHWAGRPMQLLYVGIWVSWPIIFVIEVVRAHLP